jgi:hypothetical protein
MDDMLGQMHRTFLDLRDDPEVCSIRRFGYLR